MNTGVDGSVALRRAIWALGMCLTIGLSGLIAEPQGGMEGVTLDGQSVAGMSLPSIRKMAHQRLQQRVERPMIFQMGGRTVTVSLRQLGIRGDAELALDADPAAARAWLKGRELSLMARLKSRLMATAYGYDEPLPGPRISEEAARRLAHKLSDERTGPRFVLREGVPVVMPGAGATVSKESACAALASALEAGMDRVMLSEPSSQPLPVITRLLAAAQTKIATRSQAAIANMRLATAALDGAIALPGEILSFNGIVGRRTPGGGYLVAPVLIRGRRADGPGGGICQVSTTLYEAARSAGGALAVVERHAHSRPVRYAKPGRDATVDYGRKDLRLRNVSGGPLALRSRLSDRTVRIEIWSGPPQIAGGVIGNES